MRPMVLGLACALAAMLTGCGTPRVGSVSGGEKHALTAPPCAVKSTTAEGQQWVDETTEAGVSALEWQRPARVCAGEPQHAKPAGHAAAAPAPAAKKQHWWQRKKS